MPDNRTASWKNGFPFPAGSKNSLNEQKFQIIKISGVPSKPEPALTGESKVVNLKLNSNAVLRDLL
jgi:hypothetical protein